MADEFEQYRVSKQSKQLQQPVDEFEQYKVQTKKQPESFGTSASLAIPRLYEDATKNLYKAVQAIPSYWEKAKTEVPGLPNLIEEHPIHAAGQGLAGLGEAVNFISQLPLNTAKYLGSERLNLLPGSVQNAIQKLTLPDASQAINQLFGEPKYPGEAAVRGVGRNILPIAGATKAISAMPHLTARGATQKLKEARKMSDERNIGKINVDPQLVNDARQFLPKTSPHRTNLKTAGKGDYDALFRLQSDLGKHASDYAKSLFSAAERQHGRAGLQTRGQLLDAMHENLQSQGHHDISNLLKAGQNDYRKYMKFKPWRNALALGGLGAAGLSIPDNPIAKTLKSILFQNNQ